MILKCSHPYLDRILDDSGECPWNPSRVVASQILFFHSISIHNMYSRLNLCAYRTFFPLPPVYFILFASIFFVAVLFNSMFTMQKIYIILYKYIYGSFPIELLTDMARVMQRHWRPMRMEKKRERTLMMVLIVKELNKKWSRKRSMVVVFPCECVFYSVCRWSHAFHCGKVERNVHSATTLIWCI